MGSFCIGRSDKELIEDIEKSLDDNWTSREERKKLLELQRQIFDNQL